MNAPADFSLDLAQAHSLREIDAALGYPKGCAFRAFKSLPLQEGIDFCVLHPNHDALAFAAVQAAGRLYPGAQRAILVSEGARRRIEQVVTSTPALLGG
jgi:hypothetical protein